MIQRVGILSITTSILLLLMGCTKTLGNLTPGNADPISLNAYNGASIMVTSDFPESKFDDQHLQNALIQGFKAHSVFEQLQPIKDAEQNPLPLKVHAHIVKWVNVDRDRFFAGAFAGWNQLTVDFDLIDVEKNQSIGKFQIEGKSKSALSMGGKMSTVMTYITREAVTHLKKFKNQ